MTTPAFLKYCAAGATASLLLQVCAAHAEESSIIAPVLSVYASTSRADSVDNQCWASLISQRQLLIRQEQARPWFVRNMTPLIGAAMGMGLGAYVLKSHFSAEVASRWMLPVVAGSGLAGYQVGPGGVIGTAVGAKLGAWAGRNLTGPKEKMKKPLILAGAVGGAAAGKALWDMVFPPAVPAEATEDNIPVEVFLRDKTCENRLQASYDRSLYRVAYRFNGEDLSADLDYDPGEALLLDAEGKPLAPARLP